MTDNDAHGSADDKLASELLRNYRAELEAIVESSEDAIVTMTLDGVITRWNAAAIAALRSRRRGRAGPEGLPALRPAPGASRRDQVSHPRCDQPVGNESPTLETGACKDRSQVPISFPPPPVADTGGNVVGVASIASDITERKLTAEELQQRVQESAEAEERMRSVVNHVVDGIISIDEHGTVTTFNPAAERIFGYLAQDVIGQNIKMLMPEPFHSQHDGYIANYLRTGQAKIIGIGREVVGRRKDGSTFPMDLAISVFRLGEGRHFTGIVRDITERKRAEEADAGKPSAVPRHFRERGPLASVMLTPKDASCS